MDEDKVRENNNSNTRPQPIVYPLDDQPSSEGSEDTFLSLSPDSSSGHFKRVLENNGIYSPKVEKNLSNKQLDSKAGFPNVDKNGSDKQQQQQQQQQEPPKPHHIDTAAPFESVKEAVQKFGVIVDWKAHRAQTNERREYIEQELVKAEQEIPVFRRKAELAEQAKEQALRDLDGTKRLIQELKLNLERAQTEERQAKQDSELAYLRVQEMELGITDESSVAAKTQLEVAKARHQAAASELVTATNELEETRKDYQVLASERDAAIRKAEEAVSQAKEIEREVEDLTIQLITTKESIESTHASHLEAEEHRIQEIKEREQGVMSVDQELKQTEKELEKVNQQISLAKDLRSKLETSSGILRKMKDELAIYMQGKMPEVEDDDQFTRKDIQSGVAVAKKNLDEVNREIESTTENIICLKTTATSLTAQLEKQKQVLTNVRKQKGLGAGAVVNLESELKETRSELDDVRKRAKEAQEKLAELPKKLQKATEEADKARSAAEKARSVLEKAKTEAEEAKTGENSVAGKLATIQKQIDEARAQEKIALGAINALHESESSKGQKGDDLKGAVTVSLQEYYEMSKRAHAAEEAANKRIEEAEALIDAAKESEMQSLIKLTQLNSENAAIKDALNAANQRAESARESTMSIEEELRKRKGGEDVDAKPEPQSQPQPQPQTQQQPQPQPESQSEPQPQPKKAEATSGVGGLFRRLRERTSQEPASSPTPASGNSTPNAKGVTPDAKGGTPDAAAKGESTKDAPRVGGLFRRFREKTSQEPAPSPTPASGNSTPDVKGGTPDAKGGTHDENGGTPDAAAKGESTKDAPRVGGLFKRFREKTSHEPAPSPTPALGNSMPDAKGGTHDENGGTPDATAKGESTKDAPRVGGLFRRFREKTSHEPAPSPTPASGNSTPDAKGVTPDAKGGTPDAKGGTPDAKGSTHDENGGTPEDAAAGESTKDGKGFFRLKKKSVMPKFAFMSNVKKKPFSKNSS